MRISVLPSLFAPPWPRRAGLLACASLAWAAAGGCALDEPRFASPPVIVIDIDTLRADHLGCYGYRRDTSHHIDSFSKEAVRFEWAFSQAPNTPPSQSSIFTSLYPSTHGRRGNKKSLPENIVTLAESLQQAGYRTAAFVDGGLMAKGFGLEQGFEIYDDAAGGVRHIGPKAVDWIRQRTPERYKRRGDTKNPLLEPFFLLVHTYDVHSPYENSPEPYLSMFLDGFKMPSEHFRNNMSKTMAEVWKARGQKDPPHLSREELDYAIAMYDSGIRHVDAWFGRFVEFLKEKGIYDQVILVVISDHGDAFQEHGALFHERIYASVTRIPFMIRFPEGRKRGVFDGVVESIDMMPTLLEMVGVSGPSAMQGADLLPLLEDLGPRQVGHGGSSGVAISESPYFGRRIAVTTDRNRLLYTLKTGDTELYRYREDLMEQQDLAGENAGEVQRLREMAQRWRKQALAARIEAKEIEKLDPKTEKQLRALGYID